MKKSIIKSWKRSTPLKRKKNKLRKKNKQYGFNPPFLDFIINKRPFRDYLYVTSLNTSFQYFHISNHLSPLRLANRGLIRLLSNKVRSLLLPALKTRKRVELRTNLADTNAQFSSPTNFFNHNFFTLKPKFITSTWTLIGSPFNDNSIELVPLKDWKFDPVLDTESDEPQTLITKARYRSWQMNKGLFRLDRRRGLKIRKPRPVLGRSQSQSALYLKFQWRFTSQSRVRSTLSLRNLGRWVSRKHYTYSTPSFLLKHTDRHLRQTLVRKSSKAHKLLHWRQKLKRFKRLNYKLHRSRLRFMSNKARTTRIKAVQSVKKVVARFNTGRALALTNSANSLLRSSRLMLTLADNIYSVNSRFRRNWAGFLLTISNQTLGFYPKTFLTRHSRRKSRRIRRRRYRALTQKAHTLRSVSTLPLGTLARKSNWINKRLFQSRYVKLPFSRKPQEPSRWRHSYPYLFTNSVGPNKFIGPSLLQIQLATNLVPTRIKRSSRTKLSVHKKLSKLKPYKWSRFKSYRHGGYNVSNLKLLNPIITGGVHELSSRLWKNSLTVGPIRSLGTNKWNKYSSRLRVTDMVIHQLSSRRARNELLARRTTGLPLRRLPATPRKITLRVLTTPVYRLNGRLIRRQVPNKRFEPWNCKLNLAWPNASMGSPNRTRYVAPKSSSLGSVNDNCVPITYLPVQHRAVNPFSKAVIRASLYTKKSLPRSFFTKPSILSSLKHNKLLYNTRSFAPQSLSSPELKTRTSQNFTLQSSLMFFTKLLLKNEKYPYTYKYAFKKKLFSFLYPNQVRNALLMRKKKIIFYKLVYKTRQLYKNRSFYWPRNLKKHFDRNSKLELKNRPNSLFEGSDLLFNRLNSQGTHLPFTNFSQRWHEVSDEHQFSFRGMDNSFRISEVRIPRIRFKPGYQRLWRQARTALQESLKLKFIYQKKLSRYVVRFFKQTNYYTFSKSEMSLEKTLMYSRLLPDLPTVNIFLDQNLVYLNGRSTTASKASVFQNDLLQLIVSKWYYIAYRWIANWTLKRHKKFKRLVYRKGLAGKHKVMKLRKQRSYYTPHWIYLARYDISDIKPYLEVDYLTLSVFVIYNPYLLYYYSPDDTPDLRSTIYRLYNWKYIT